MLTDRKDVIFGSSKTYNHSIGLSCCFRQWRAKSHCRFLHGYALKVHIEFEALDLDENNWVVDFGGMKSFKAWLEELFDHKTLIALDDPEIDTFKKLDQQGLIQIKLVPSVGVEAFSFIIFSACEEWLANEFRTRRVRVKKVTVSEHEGNSASTELHSQVT